MNLKWQGCNGEVITVNSNGEFTFDRDGLHGFNSLDAAMADCISHKKMLAAENRQKMEVDVYVYSGGAFSDGKLTPCTLTGIHGGHGNLKFRGSPKLGHRAKVFPRSPIVLALIKEAEGLEATLSELMGRLYECRIHYNAHNFDKGDVDAALEELAIAVETAIENTKEEERKNEG